MEGSKLIKNNKFYSIYYNDEGRSGIDGSFILFRRYDNETYSQNMERLYNQKKVSKSHRVSLFANLEVSNKKNAACIYSELNRGIEKGRFTVNPIDSGYTNIINPNNRDDYMDCLAELIN